MYFSWQLLATLHHNGHTSPYRYQVGKNSAQRTSHPLTSSMGDYYRASRISVGGQAGQLSGERSLEDLVSRNVMARLRRDPPPARRLEVRGVERGDSLDVWSFLQLLFDTGPGTSEGR